MSQKSSIIEKTEKVVIRSVCVCKTSNEKRGHQFESEKVGVYGRIQREKKANDIIISKGKRSFKDIIIIVIE